MDGNTGIVNNNLNGFNGYLYKVISSKYSNWEVYYSLKHKYNQKIIKINEIGTTIKHSPNSKKEIKHVDFKNLSLEFIFWYEIKVEKLVQSLNKIKQNMINLLVK